SVVSKEDLPHANSLFFITQQGSLVVGFGLAGVIEKLIGFEGSLILCSVFLFVAFISSSFLNEMKPKTRIPDTFEKIFKTFFGSILEGYEFIKSKKSILFPLLLLLGIQASLAVAVVSLPVVATQILDIPVGLAGLSLVVPAGIGALLGSVYISKILKMGTRKKTLIKISLALTGICVLILSFGVPFIPGILRIIVTPILIILIGLGFIGINIPTMTYLQETTPEWIRGRVFGNLWFLVTIVTIFPVLFSGAITELFGVRTLFAIMAIGMLSLLIYINKKGSNLMEYGN
ncbi:MAG TPA: MFS transporter, partial [Patescibacteria group bacterium]|nr:MFS transporter [Patescibacteria group bacterium]